MDTLVLKVVLTPALIAAASLAGRRWGSVVSGWLVGLPFTSAPIIYFLALSQGAPFATATATGTLAGGVSQVAFCLAYSWAAQRGGWCWALLGGSLAFALSTVALHGIVLAPLPLFAGVLFILTIALRLLPRERSAKATSVTPITPTASPAWWDLPARMAMATGVVLLLTASAPLLGPHLTGLLAPFPVYAAILTVFAQRQYGPRRRSACCAGCCSASMPSPPSSSSSPRSSRRSASPSPSSSPSSARYSCRRARSRSCAECAASMGQLVTGRYLTLLGWVPRGYVRRS